MTTARRLHYIPDRELVSMAQRGSLEACDELATRFRDAVLLTAGQILGSREAAQDVAQETFLLAFRSLSQLHDPDRFAGWLHAIARHRARRVSLQTGRMQPVTDANLETLMTVHDTAPVPTPLEHVLRDETETAIRALLADLSPDCRLVIHLFYYEQWTAARIADYLSLPLTTIKWRLRAGRKQLAQRLPALLEENPDVRHRQQERDTPHEDAAAKNGGDGRACGADRQLRDRHRQLRETLQQHCGASGGD